MAWTKALQAVLCRLSIMTDAPAMPIFRGLDGKELRYQGREDEEGCLEIKEQAAGGGEVVREAGSRRRDSSRRRMI